MRSVGPAARLPRRRFVIAIAASAGRWLLTAAATAACAGWRVRAAAAAASCSDQV